MNGVVVIDKPSGPTSRDVVEEVKRALGVRKAGHTGTLDPLATGVLPVCLDEATKLVQFLALDSKEYRATLLLGVRTDTLDTEGIVLTREEPRVTREQVEAALKGLTGKRKQVPPRYSAVKVRGKALYDWTRRGIDVEASGAGGGDLRHPDRGDPSSRGDLCGLLFEGHLHPLSLRGGGGGARLRGLHVGPAPDAQRQLPRGGRPSRWRV